MVLTQVEKCLLIAAKLLSTKAPHNVDRVLIATYLTFALNQ